MFRRLSKALVLFVCTLAATTVVHAQPKNQSPATIASADGNKIAQSCCNLTAGQRVMAIVDNPGGSPSLPAGTLGTVVCCDETDPSYPLNISWDNWTGGNDDDLSFCTTPDSIVFGPPGSHWWVSCGDIRSAETNFTELELGVRVRVLFDNSNGALDLPKGSTGTVLCYDFDAPGHVWVAFDGWGEGTVSLPCAIPTSLRWPVMSTAWSIPEIDLELLPIGCGLRLNDRVRFMGGGDAPNLVLGTMGTVVCVDYDSVFTDELQALVSWDDWSEGHDEVSECLIAPYYTGPANSHYWMRCSEAALITPVDCGFEPGDRIRLVVDNPSESTLLAGHKGTVACVSNNPAWEWNLLVSWDSWTEGDAAPREHCDTNRPPHFGPPGSHLYVKCSDVAHLQVCSNAYSVGDRVENLVDDWFLGLYPGMIGSVVCVDEVHEDLPVLVSWDDWHGGTPDNVLTNCSSTPEAGPDDSCGWMACDDLIPASCCGFKKGDRVVLRVSDPDGGGRPGERRGLPIGREGTVACTDVDGGNYVLLVRFDGFEYPSNGTEQCDSAPLTGETGQNAWWVGCRQVRPAKYNGWDYCDFDQSLCTDLSDFLFLLDSYQTHTFLEEFLTLLDNWQQGRRCKG